MTEIAPQYNKALYSVHYACWDACYGHPNGGSCFKVCSFDVTRVTAKRIYFLVRRYMEANEHFVDRAVIERDGVVYHRGSPGFLATRLYLIPPELSDHQQGESVDQLRREMAGCHPDVGGEPAEFRAAHARYMAAKAAVV